MKQYAMVIDLQKCVGCGTCAIACKTENNTPARKNGQTNNWADFVHETTGQFPNTNYRTLPVLCNHCDKPPCVEECPTEPTSVFKTPDGITMRNEDRCIGCRSCQDACPYSMEDVTGEGQYSVISYLEEGKPVHSFYEDSQELIPGITSSGKEVAMKAKSTPPYKHSYVHGEYSDSPRSNIITKCIFCDHRVKDGELPYCVEACPSSARIFGDKNDPSSKVAKALAAEKNFVLKPEAGTEPNVFYVRSYKKA
jgi:Fe-S-cluster-containing dehydrogenase component